MRERDLLRTRVSNAIVREADVQIGRYPTDSLRHELVPDVLPTYAGVHDEAAELPNEVRICAYIDHDRGRRKDLAFPVFSDQEVRVVAVDHLAEIGLRDEFRV